MPVSIFFHAVITTDEGITHCGSPLTPVVISGDDYSFQRTASVAASGTETLFSTANDLDDFDFLVVEADGDLMLELSTDINNGVGDENFTLEVKSGIPFVIAGDASYANYTVNFGGGTLDVIERIRVKNLGSSAVRARLTAYT